MNGFTFSAAAEKEIEETISRYPTKRAALLPVLWIAHRQNDRNHLDADAIRAVAQRLELSEAFVGGVVSFYTMYNRRPIGRYHLQVCRTLSCALSGCDKLLDHLKSQLEIDVGQTTTDQMFTLSTVECLASCGTGPMMQVNDDFYEKLTTEQVDQLLSELRRRGANIRG